MIGLVTDSNAQLPADLRERYQVGVVPLTVVLDEQPYQEGVDLTTAEFYERLTGGATVSTAAPSPGAVLAVYEEQAAAGATEILSIHIGSNTSATVNAVTVAAGSSPVPVEVVDTGTASFAVACCVWAAGEALAAGADSPYAADVARRVAAELGNVFIVGALDLARGGGRLAAGAADGDGVPVLALAGGQMEPVGRAHDVESAVDVMTDYFVDVAGGVPQRVGVGDAVTPELAAEYAARLAARPEVTELVRYEIGPSVGAHTGAGTVGACFFPLSP
ncbi:MAG TPA: DegV family protein [Acidimicrobiia bacterium]|nr:DegV family protein [Acidimicrobiia bacterium]